MKEELIKKLENEIAICKHLNTSTAIGIELNIDEINSILQALSQSEGEKERVMKEHALDFHIKCTQKILELERAIWTNAYLKRIKKVSEDFYFEYIKLLPPQTK